MSAATAACYVYNRPLLKPRIYFSRLCATPGGVWVFRWVDRDTLVRMAVEDTDFARLFSRLKYIIPTAYIPRKPLH